MFQLEYILEAKSIFRAN